ncbi:hypothetical protein HII12_001716 [Brettanomyces bruxellensis]|uniref:Uncharacterized protein n=1 Tax=Dekkera bruxellensis TaxID=5007 RepID=A0A8H6BJY2_DEKBR|nr:hypothetical protein HII12_001716 [Brettanomyces bruxellensis]
MAYASAFRPAVLLFFFIRQPVAATALIDRNFDLGVRKSFNKWRNNLLEFPTSDSQRSAFQRIDEIKRQELALKSKQ